MHKTNLDHEKQHNESIKINRDYETNVDTIVRTGLEIKGLAFRTRWKRLGELPIMQIEAIVDEANKKRATSSEANLDPEAKLSDLESFPGTTPPNPNRLQADGDATTEDIGKHKNLQSKLKRIPSNQLRQKQNTNVCVCVCGQRRRYCCTSTNCRNDRYHHRPNGSVTADDGKPKIT